MGFGDFGVFGARLCGPWSPPWLNSHLSGVSATHHQNLSNHPHLLRLWLRRLWCTVHLQLPTYPGVLQNVALHRLISVSHRSRPRPLSVIFLLYLWWTYRSMLPLYIFAPCSLPVQPVILFLAVFWILSFSECKSPHHVRPSEPASVFLVLAF